jgi:2-haloacid dehalogenase
MPSDAACLPDVEAFIFDAYGTLFDVHSAVARHAEAVGPNAAQLSELWRVKQLEYTWVLSLAGRYEPFWTLTQRALDYALAHFPNVDPAVRARLLDAYRALDAYPEVAGVLTRLRERGAKIGILSNGDPGMLREAVASAGLGALLDAVLSVEDAGVFKTSPRAYGLVGSTFGTRAETVAFVSSNRWDIAGAAAFGFRPVWVNRAGLPDEYAGLEPIAVVSALSALA